MRPTGSATELEIRRKDAVRRLRAGERVTDVARAFGVSRIAVYQWKRNAQEQGLRGLNATPQHVPQSRLSNDDRRRLKAILLRGAMAWGFPTDLWTCGRVAQVIQKEFDAQYHPGHVSRILHAIEFSCQKPAKQARERDDRAAEEFRNTTWPLVKKGRKSQCQLGFH
jgi:transposase